jgi:hypothetical protein
MSGLGGLGSKDGYRPLSPWSGEGLMDDSARNQLPVYLRWPWWHTELVTGHTQTLGPVSAVF